MALDNDARIKERCLLDLIVYHLAKDGHVTALFVLKEEAFSRMLLGSICESADNKRRMQVDIRPQT